MTATFWHSAMRPGASAKAASGLDDHGEDADSSRATTKRDVAVDGHFSLEQLLAGGIHVGGVGEGDAAAELLLHRDTRGGVAERAQIIGIDFDRAGAK